MAKRVKEIIRKTGEQRRREFLDAGLELFLEKGYEDATVDDIVEKVGVAKGTFYIYFKSKEEFFGDLFDGFVGEILGLMGEALSDEGLSAWEKVGSLYELAKDNVSEYADFIVLFHRVSTDVGFAGRQFGTNMRITKEFKKIIDQGIDEGTMEAMDSEMAAFFLLSMAWQSANDAITLGLPLPIEELLPYIFQFVVDFLAPTG